MRSRTSIDCTQIHAHPCARPSYNLAIMIPADLLEIWSARLARSRWFSSETPSSEMRHLPPGLPGSG